MVNKKYFTEEQRKEANRLKAQRWRERYPERAKEIARQANSNETHKRWYEANKEKLKEYSRQHYYKHREQKLEQDKISRLRKAVDNMLINGKDIKD